MAIVWLLPKTVLRTTNLSSFCKAILDVTEKVLDFISIICNFIDLKKGFGVENLKTRASLM